MIAKVIDGKAVAQEAERILQKACARQTAVV